MSYADELSNQFFKKSYRVSQYPGTPAASTRKFYSTHKGTDYAMPVGTPIYAPSNMQLAFTGSRVGYGNRVGVVDPTTGQSYFFSHLSKIPQLQKDIPAGTIIGYSGGRPGDQGAGWSTGAHVDVETYNKGQSYPRGYSQQVASIPQSFSSVSNAISRSARSVNPQAIIEAVKKQYGGQAMAVSNNINKLKQLAAQRGGKIVRVSV